MMNERLLTTGDAARVAEITPMGIYAAMKRGQLMPAGRTEGGQYLYTRSTVLEYVRTRRPKGEHKGS